MRRSATAIFAESGSSKNARALPMASRSVEGGTPWFAT